MRVVPGSFLVCCVWAAVASAQPPPVLSVDAHAVLRVGDRASLVVRVALPPDAAQPVLLTTGSEGTALEVVRGRFVRPDAVDATAATLRFEVPVVARAAGTASVRAHVLFYRCTETCVAVEQDAQVWVEIAPQ